VAGVKLGDFEKKSSKIVLLGSSHLEGFNEFATIEAVQMTEVYIYACQFPEHETNFKRFQVPVNSLAC
jgi:hypothetical protein